MKRLGISASEEMQASIEYVETLEDLIALIRKMGGKAVVYLDDVHEVETVPGDQSYNVVINGNPVDFTSKDQSAEIKAALDAHFKGPPHRV